LHVASQGGIIYKAPGEAEAALLAADIHRAGAGICKDEAVQRLANEGPAAVERFLLPGGLNGSFSGSTAVAFDRAHPQQPPSASPDVEADTEADAEAKDDKEVKKASSEELPYALCLEASHSKARILHCGDRSGQAIMVSLVAACAAHPSITLLPGATAVDLILLDSTTTTTTTTEGDGDGATDGCYGATDGCYGATDGCYGATDGCYGATDGAARQEAPPPTAEAPLPPPPPLPQRACAGAWVLVGPASAVPVAVRAGATVLATGGAGELWEHTSNPPCARGDGVAMALRAGARSGGMAFMQFHPTTLYVPGERRFLLTEALRGVGAALLDPLHRRPFARTYHPDGELAPRDVVARMISSEMAKAGGAPFVYLDCRHLFPSLAAFADRFPGVAAHLASKGLDPTTDLLPVVPAAHYFCGGVEVDGEGRTSVAGLWAAGECAWSGLHGANRLASTSLLEGLVWGAAAARSAAKDQAVAATAAAASAKTSSEPPKTAGDVAAPVVSPAPAYCARGSSLACLVVGDYHGGGGEVEGVDEDVEDPLTFLGAAGDAAVADGWAALKRTMWADVGIARTPQRLVVAAAELAGLARRAERAFCRRAAECAAVAAEAAEGAPLAKGSAGPAFPVALLGLRNASAVAAAVAAAAAELKRSAGTHFLVLGDETRAKAGSE